MGYPGLPQNPHDTRVTCESGQIRILQNLLNIRGVTIDQASPGNKNTCLRVIHLKHVVRPPPTLDEPDVLAVLVLREGGRDFSRDPLEIGAREVPTIVLRSSWVREHSLVDDPVFPHRG